MNLQFGYDKRADLVRSVLATQFGVTQMDVDGTRKVVVTASAMGKACAVDIETLGIIDQLIDGQGSDAFNGLTFATLTAKEIAETAFAVDDDADFAAGDICVVMNYGDGTSAEWGQLVSAATNVLTFEQAMTGTFYKNAVIIKLELSKILASMGLGFNRQEGVRSQQEAPSAPLFSVANHSGDNTIDVTVTDNDEDAATHYDIYVRKQTARPTFDPLWEPDAKDKTVAQIQAGVINVSTYEGGADFVPDGGGGSLASTDVVWVGVAAKNGTGINNIKRSPIDWQTITID